jgi:trans-aconitate methyltransferase
VGCGPGINSVLFARSGIQKVVGVDYADGMLDIARNNIPPEYSATIHYEKADFLAWKTSDKFDCTAALGVFDYLDQPGVFLEKMLSHTNKKAIFSVPCKGNLRQYIRAYRYRMKKCPLFFYNKNEIDQLLAIRGAHGYTRAIGSSGVLCIVDLQKK